ncbi:tyrosine-type recombinase/integrase [Streptomyces sp. BBFR102]|uniref:tyrosine-type recombinase/integrase n=1 Tax=Streptomyces sp. BBFR102 TaxID=3448171 RepID=UPI003F534890
MRGRRRCRTGRLGRRIHLLQPAPRTPVRAAQGQSVYKHLAARKRHVPGLPPDMTLHWYRHTHATALLLSGVPMHVVSRRLGHADTRPRSTRTPM